MGDDRERTLAYLLCIQEGRRPRRRDRWLLQGLEHAIRDTSRQPLEARVKSARTQRKSARARPQRTIGSHHRHTEWTPVDDRTYAPHALPIFLTSCPTLP